MITDPAVLAAIAGMALATYLTRAGGYLLFRTMPTPAWLRTAFGYVPGTLFVSYVAPGLVAGTWDQWLGAAVTMGLMLVTKNMSVAILGGTGVAWLAWSFA